MKVGVIGAGVMGKGVAQSLAQSRHNVVLIDVSDEVLDQARTALFTNIRFSGFYNKDTEAEDPETVLSRVEFTTHYDSLSDADFIIENVPEQWDVKKRSMHSLKTIAPILAFIWSIHHAFRLQKLVPSPDDLTRSSVYIL